MTLERAAAMGFRREEAEVALRIVEVMNWAPETFDVAMDLARFAKVPLAEATEALVAPRRLRRFGFIVPTGSDPLAFVRDRVEGQAEAYAKTLYGSLAVREAQQGHPFSRRFWGTLERIFGPRFG